MSMEILSSLMTHSIALTKKSKNTGTKLKLKVFWKTINFWNEQYISEYHKSAHSITQKLTEEKYWSKNGETKNHHFTCEDFAIRVLCEFASKKQLPVKLTTGKRTYKNMEIYTPTEHDSYPSHMIGFAEMVMLTYGAPDMQRTDQNVLTISSTSNLLPGDLLAQAYDRHGNIAHHIQLVVNSTPTRIDIRQGNTNDVIVRPFTTVKRLFGANMADPMNDSYAGMPIQDGFFEKSGSSWDYRNPASSAARKDFLKIFQLYRWNFMEFNKS